MKRFLVEYDEKCGKQGVSDPATFAAADLALWIDRAVLDVLAEYRKLIRDYSRGARRAGGAGRVYEHVAITMQRVDVEAATGG